MAPRTTSATGERRPRAFTLLETLIVIALAGLVATLAVAGIESLLTPDSRPSPRESLAQAIAAGRDAATATGASVSMEFSPETGALRVTSATGTKEFPIAADSVAFAMPADEASGVETPLSALRFHPSGCMTPALIRLTASGVSATWRVEPLSGAVGEDSPP